MMATLFSLNTSLGRGLARLAACLLPCFALPLAVGQVQAATQVAEYRFDDVNWCTPVAALDTTGTHHGSLIREVRWFDSPAAAGKPVTGAAAGFADGAVDITGLPLDLAPDAVNSVSFWMYWDGVDNGMPLGFGLHDLWFHSGSFGFNTFNTDVFGIASAGLGGGWHHVAAVFTNGNVAANKLWIDGVPQALTQRSTSPNNANAVVSPHLRLSGVWGNTGYMFGGALDSVRVYTGALTQTDVDRDRTASSPAVLCPPPLPPPPPELLAHYRFDDGWDSTHTTANVVVGGAADFLPSYATRIAAPAVAPNKPNTCSAAAFTTANGPARASGIPLDLASGGKNSVSFWMYWDGGNSQMPFGFLRYDLWLVNGSFGFNTSNSDVYGISSAGLANGWHHVAAVFTNGDVTANKLWIDGVPQTLSQRQASPSNTYAQAATTFQLSSWTYDDRYRFGGRLDEVKVYRGELTDALVLGDFTDICVVADWRMDEAAWSGAANEVRDSGGGQYHGTARVAAGATPVPTTAADSPARSSGGESTCAYGEFDTTTAPVRSHSYIELPTFPALPGSFTFAAWIRSTNAAAQHQRILARDDANNGWGLSLADGTGRPELRFFSRNISNSGVVTGQGRNPNCGAFCLDSDPVISSNAWYYIAAAIDAVGKTVTLYVFDAAGALLAQTSAGFAGTWQDGSGLVTIGGESATSAEGQQAAWHFLGNIDELRIFSGVLSATDIRNMQARTRTCTGGPVVRPASFNCVHSGADAASGHLFTQIAGSAFSFDVAALKADGSVETAYATDADKRVSVELVDGAGSTACAARPAISPALTQTLTFAKADQPVERGRKAVAGLVVDRAYADLRCRVTDSSRSPSVVACSSDNFAVRPSALTVSSNADAGGSSTTAVPVIKAGKNFSLIAASRTAGYDAIPKVDTSKLAAHAGALRAGTLNGSFANADPVSGAAAGTFTYSESGYFNLAADGVYDDSFTAVDAAAGDCTDDFSNTAVAGRVGCKFGNAGATAYFGRFIPDHFVVTAPSFTPACSAGGFSYMDQAFALSATVEARNSDALVTQNYHGTWARGVVGVQLENADSGVPIAATRLTGLATPGWIAGRYALTGGTLARAASGPDGPFDQLDIGLAVADEAGLAAAVRPYLLVRDMDAATAACAVDLTGLSTAPAVCSATRIVNATKVRFGRLGVGNSYGSELLPASLAVSAEYWNGTAFVRNSADSCTSLAAGNVALANYQGGLNAGNLGPSHVSVPPLVAGVGRITLARPAPTAAGSVDLVLNLGSAGLPANCPGLPTTGSTAAGLPYLSGMWCGGSFDRDPVARATFGVFKSPLIYRRENY